MESQGFQISSIKWEIESNCNLKCKHCFMGDITKNTKQINFTEAINIVNKLVDYGIKNIMFTTMEPLMFENLCELIQYCTSKGITTTVITNGTLLADYSLAERLINSGVLHISISLEGISEQSNDYIRGKGTLKRVMQAIENLKKAQVPGNWVEVGLQISLNKYSAIEAHEIPDFVNLLPIDSLHIGDISISGNAKQYPDLKLSNSEYKIAWEKILEGYRNLKVKNFRMISKSLIPFEIILYNIKNLTDFRPSVLGCSAIKNGYSLLPNGDLTPCVVLMNNCNFKLPVTNIYKFENENQSFNNFKSSIKEYVISNQNEQCMQCYFSSNCFPCPGDIHANKSIDHLTNRCASAEKEINSLMKKIFENSVIYNIAIRENTYFEINSGQFLFRRYYNHNGLTSEHRYDFDISKINLVTELMNSDYLKLSHVVMKYFKDTYEAREFIIPLLYDNYIFIKEENVYA